MINLSDTYTSIPPEHELQSFLHKLLYLSRENGESVTLLLI
jgi:hypothetical protein